ncbi:MAG TPA: LLM class flavin-dependent oxidoreductase [Ilumatobacteraceae bacterium]|nr:LLM class flavin-dependent oxidoreductase [Ilumatobacteraceae bacterium]
MSHESANGMPALSVIGVAGKRATILELAVEAERRGFAGLASPGVNGNLALCGSLAHVTSRIPFWTSIQPIYHSHATEVAITAGHLAEVSGGRFRLGLGVSHAPAMERLGIDTGRPLADMQRYVEAIRAAERQAGALPPIYLATLRNKMLDLAASIADGAIWANAALSHMPAQVARIPGERRDAFFLANMVPTVIDTDRDAARAIHRRTLSGYLVLPNYRNYWKQAGYVEEMDAIERTLAAGDRDALPGLMPDRWLDDCTISGSPTEVRERFDEWAETGVLPIAVMSSTSGGQAKAIGELFELFA